MIVEREGRSRSERTVEELEQMLKKELKTLSPAERETLELMLAELKADIQGPKLMEVIGIADYKHQPVDMRQFIRDQYYLGNTCDTLYPKWEEDLVELFEGTYQEAIFTGGIGTGKTFAASIGICRVLYELSCLKDPHRTYGIAKDSNISIVALSVNETLAIKVVFENIATKVKASPYFQENFAFEDTKKELRFPGNIWVAARATTDTSALGLNTISGFTDEVNFMPRTAKDIQAGVLDRAESIYAAIKRRMKSRFEKQGSLPGKLFIVSSKKTLDDFTAKRIRESRNDPTVFVRDYSNWDVKPDVYAMSARFHVLVGNETIPSRIIPEEELEAVRKATPEDARIISVPEDFRTDFERDLEGAIRDIAGVATVAINPFITRREKIQEAVVPQRRHPFTTVVQDPSKKGHLLWEQLVAQVEERNPYTGVRGPVPRPLMSPRTPRHVHIDPSLRGDATGFAMAHIHGWKDVIRRANTGEQFTEHAPIFVVDFLLRIVPPLGDEIVLAEVRQLVYEFISHGYVVQRVSMDSWQSADSIQTFTSKGIPAEIVSVDTSTDPYDNLKMALYENRIFYYDYPPLLEELRTLERHNNGRRVKIDHPAKGSKDVADALAGCCWTLQQNATAQPLPPMKGQGYGDDLWMPEQIGAQAGSGYNVPPSPFFVGRGGGWPGGGGGGDDGGWGPGFP